MGTFRTAIITITPDNKECQADIQTGAVSTLEILDCIETLRVGFSKQLVAEYIEITGDKLVNGNKFNDWINFLRANKV